MDNILGQIDISIDKARIRSIVVSYDENGKLPDFAINLDLLSTGGKKVTEVMLSTSHWRDELKINTDFLPANIYEIAGKLLSAFGEECTRKINSIDQLLEEPE